ncbi:hypothetical protein ACFWNN_27050 [Lentzea sp. NPDC058450]|uniref:hypothetical protein n=1 Tax=Lentzea sp. NPDC058450 TaxID=3346505 RepID=UPI00366775C8
MKRFLPVLGASALLVAILGLVVWQRPDAPAEAIVQGDVVVQFANGVTMWRPGERETPVVKQVLRELGVAGLSPDGLRAAGGGVVVTTIDSRAQGAANELINQFSLQKPGSYLQQSITAVDPVNGAVRAYVSREGHPQDYAGGIVRAAGTALRPFGSAEVARAAGVPEFAEVDGKIMALLADDEELLRPLDLASAYATLGADGVRHRAHFVTHVTDASGRTVYRAATAGRPMFEGDPVRSKEFAARVNEELRADPLCGIPQDAACLPAEKWSRKVVEHAWMIGYTPRLSIVVFIGSDTLVADRLGNPVTGTGLPSEHLRAFQEKLMNW